MKLKKGQQYTVGVRFRYRGQAAKFNNPPTWTLYDSQDRMILSGPATNVGEKWNAVFTVPTNYIVAEGEEALLLQFNGYDAGNRTYTVDKELTLVDEDESWRPNGAIYNALSKAAASDVLTLSTPNADITYTVLDPLGKAVVGPVFLTNQAATSRTSDGYNFEVSVVLNEEKNRFVDPYQIMYEAAGETEIHPLYILDALTLNVLGSLTQLLDKARLQEIDPSLQWNTPELIQAVLEGIKYVNAVEPEVTYWTPATFPTPLRQYLFAAAAIYALNSRLMAEGLNAFEFQGLSTTFNFNRTEALSAQLEQMNSLLEKLPAAKKSGIRVGGKGTPPAGESDFRKANIGMLGMTRNPLNNYRGGYRRNSGIWLR